MHIKQIKFSCDQGLAAPILALLLLPAMALAIGFGANAAVTTNDEAEAASAQLIRLCQTFELLRPATQNSMVSIIRSQSYTPRDKLPFLKLSSGEVTLVEFFQRPQIRAVGCAEVINDVMRERTYDYQVSLGVPVFPPAGVDLSVLQYLRSIQSLRLDCFGGFPGEGLRALRYQPGLQELVIMAEDDHLCRAFDPSSIGELKSLRNLTVIGASLKELGWLKPLSSLLDLNLRMNRLRTVQGIEHLLNLRKLNLDNNPLTDISGLLSLVNLSELSLDNASGLSQIEVVKYMSNLTDLKVTSSGLESLNGVEDLPWLQSATFWRNQLTDISPLRHSTRLKYLNLSYNQIADVSALAKLTNLNGLDLGSNLIVDGSPLRSLTGLSNLGLARNKISSYQFLEALIRDGDLFMYDTTGNPAEYAPPKCPGNPACPANVPVINFESDRPSNPINVPDKPRITIDE